MNHVFAAAMRRATLLTRARDVAKATRVIQKALSGRGVSEQTDTARTVNDVQPRPERPMLRLIPQDAGITQTSPDSKSLTGPATGDAGAHRDMAGLKPLRRVRKPLAEALRLLREGRLRTGAPGPLPGMTASGIMKTSQPPPIPKGAQFVTRSFSCAAGTRSYKLYLPASALDRPHGLIVMLHGCKQDPDDFAVGTNMNAVAEAHGLMVAYPAQPGSANASSCWNWFNPADQMRDAGEPAIVAGITREIMAEFYLNRNQVFVAGLSAGGAMAAVMGETYPDLYAAVGIHSGLAYKSASDVMSAYAAMRGERGQASSARPSVSNAKPAVRTIVFHGSADQTVSPANVDSILESATRQLAHAPTSRARGSSEGRAYTRSVISGPDGSPAAECWMIDGARHAWSGGHPGGSYTDPLGPNASVEMMRFFLAP